jgi:hypothetical protein
MPKRSSKRTEDPSSLVFQIVAAATEMEDIIKKPSQERKKNKAAVALGRLGGRKGGKARAEKLSPEERKEIARKAAQARWSKSKNKA